MLHPSYAELIQSLNSDVVEGEAPVVNSRYSVVLNFCFQIDGNVGNIHVIRFGQCSIGFSVHLLRNEV